LKTSGVETTGETTYATGGRGSARLVGFSSNRQARLNLEDAIFDNQALAMLTGNDPTVGARKVTINEVITVGTGNKASLTKTPVGDPISVHKVNDDGTNGDLLTKGTPATNPDEWSITTKEMTFNVGVTVGSKIRVYYEANTDATATTIKVTSDKFGGTFKVVMDVLIRDEYTQQDFAGQLIIPNAKFEDNFNLNFSASGDPATLTLPLEILKSSTGTDMWELVIYNAEEIV
jgi:hypothetical protein